MMNYLYGKNYQTVQAIIESPFFDRLVDYLINHDSVILRELKKQFADEHLFEKNLEKLIAAKIIIRENRRYTFGGEILNEKSSLVDPQFSVDPTLLNRHLLMQLANRLKAISAEDFYLVKTDQLAYFKTYQTPYFSWQILYKNPRQTNVATYFTACATQNHLDAHQEMYTLIGDVDVIYYLDQIEVLIEKIKKGRRRIRGSIFVSSAEKFGLIQAVDERLMIAKDVIVGEEETLENFEAIFQLFDNYSAIEQRQILADLMQQLNVEQVQKIK
ncbi:DUF1803 domain-containing protein [Enterococcus columbae]|uniref:DUF1803 domain-containing protein n=1 Tax=Enterococcus columbae DSM 7374 = ATCC 51263 TaxID=1121865 RepID=S0KHF8_9ENTE|nr:DUF1803 domain-containing protein [Enterococcus columbae]EOT44264.1 hypothetical protein OMW_00319 [Enterococcus columbae DSM 7374 = ATCC 51263]EOW84422.1 hypothetical protein I568_00917 [Enterococcus columbae DSM 7374 = ATCC 51263]